MRLIKTLTQMSLLGLVASVAFSANTASVNVTATVLTSAIISGIQPTLAFANVDPTVLSTTDIVATPQTVSIYDNNAGAGTQISTTCTKTDAQGNGCYICAGGSCTTSAAEVLLSCTYTPCGTGSPAVLTITPGATVSGTGYTQDVPAANASPSVCQTNPGAFNCTLKKTGLLNTSGAYNGTLNLTVSDG